MDGWINVWVQYMLLQSKCGIQTDDILVFLFRIKTQLFAIAKLVCNIKVLFRTCQ